MANAADNRERHGSTGSGKVRGTERGENIQFNFPNGVGSEYKHKGFITGRSLLKAGVNSPSQSRRNGRTEGEDKKKKKSKRGKQGRDKEMSKKRR